MPTSPTHPLQIGLILPHWSALQPGTPFWWTSDLPTDQPDWPNLLRLAQHAEEVGFDALWVVDHLQIRVDDQNIQFGRSAMPPPFDNATVGVMECWSLLAALAATTTRVSLGPMVTCMNYRNPAVLAKVAATVDSISNGRLILGLGAGDFEEEHTQFGAAWDHRISRFEEALNITLPLLREGRVDFSGQYHRATNATLSPPPSQPGGPPIMIGALAHGQRMLNLVARHADIWNAWLASDVSSPHKIPEFREAVDSACLAIGRDPATLDRSVAVGITFGDRTIHEAQPISGTPRQIADQLLAFHAEGINHLAVWLNPMTDEGISQMAEVIHLCNAA